ncbi:protein containing Glycoside hydrolase, family 33, partial [Candidatus Thiomargarita nelsonii]
MNNDKASLWISDGTGSYKEILSNASISEDTWTYITFVGQNGTFKIFLNGVLDTNTTVPNMTQNNDAVTIGRQVLMFSPENELQFKGYIDDLRIYNRVLSESEIQQLYQPCQPSIDIVLNSNNRVTGDKVVINAHIKGPGSSDSSCEQTKVEQKIWVKLPNDTVIPLIDPFTVLTLLPF